MDKAPDFLCQPARPEAKIRFRRFMAEVLFVVQSLVGSLALAADPSSSPAPTPPVWQQELTALQVMRAASLFAPDKQNAQGQTLREHADEAFRQLGAKYPDQPEIQKACGDFCYDNGEKERAFDYWLHAQKLDPRNADLAATLGGAYLGVGNTRSAAVQYQRAVDAQPEQAQYHSALANVLYLFRHDLIDPPSLPDSEAVLVRALEQFRLAAQLSPQSKPLAQAYAETFYLLAKPDWPRALAAWQSVLALSGDDLDFANLHLARVSLRMRHPQEAETYLNQLRRPEFMVLQGKLRQQARKMAESPAAAAAK